MQTTAKPDQALIRITTQRRQGVRQLARQWDVPLELLMRLNGWPRATLSFPAGSRVNLPDTAEVRKRAAVVARQHNLGETGERRYKRDGLTLPAGFGLAVTFWHGTHEFDGRERHGRQGPGAWGDMVGPEEFACALPVPGRDGDRWRDQKLLITNPRNGRQVVVRVRDRGPEAWAGAAISLTPAAREALGLPIGRGARVTIAFAVTTAPVGALG